MNTIGIIGGMSPESTAAYYQTINRETNRRLGGNRSADIVMHSLDFETVAALQRAGDWDAAARLLADSARKLERAGAQALVLATNTMHKVAAQIEAAVGIPLLHIVDATAAAVRRAGLERVALLGTRFTMDDGFYHRRMAAHGLTVLTPDADRQQALHRIIFEELCRNRFTAAAKTVYLDAVAGLAAQGAQGVIFGCTEIGLLLAEDDCPLPAFDSARLHALAAVGFVVDGTLPALSAEQAT